MKENAAAQPVLGCRYVPRRDSGDSAYIFMAAEPGLEPGTFTFGG